MAYVSVEAGRRIVLRGNGMPATVLQRLRTKKVNNVPRVANETCQL